MVQTECDLEMCRKEGQNITRTLTTAQRGKIGAFKAGVLKGDFVTHTHTHTYTHTHVDMQMHVPGAPTIFPQGQTFI